MAKSGEIAEGVRVGNVDLGGLTEGTETIALFVAICLLALATLLAPERMARIVTEMDASRAAEVLETIPAEQATAVLAEMDPDDRVDILDELSGEKHDQLLAGLDAEPAWAGAPRSVLEARGDCSIACFGHSAQSSTSNWTRTAVSLPRIPHSPDTSAFLHQGWSAGTSRTS